MRLRTPLAIAATAVLAVGLSSITTASAQTSAPGDVITACVHKQTRYTRIVNASAKCKPTEGRITWGGETQQGIATAGPQGERGPQGPQGVKGDAGPQGAPGARGLRGVPGVKGEPGKPGADGKDGAPGKDGADGKDGQDASELKYITLDLAALGIPGGKQYTCTDVDPNPAVFKTGNCKKGGAPVTPSASPTPTPTVPTTPSPSATAS
jgi:hypothetical protein